MTTVKQLVGRGLRCPNCEGKELRACYHDWQVLGSFVCETCGYRWQEDCSVRNGEYFNTRFGESRFVWALVHTSLPQTIILNSASSDSQGFQEFIKKGTTRKENLLEL